MSFQSPPRSPATSPKREDKNEHPRVVLGGGVGWDPANYPARDPKECVAVRILKGKAERIISMVFIQGGLWKKRCQIGSAEDRAQDLLDGFFVEAAVQNPFVRLPV